jgi:hypothetical protein
MANQMSQMEEALDAPGPIGLSDLGGAWDTRISAALDTSLEPGSASRLMELTMDRAWTLLGWVERVASQITRVRDEGILDLAIFALQSIGRSEVLDLRDVLVVGGLLKRGSKYAQLDFESGINRVESRVGEHPFFSTLLLVSVSLPPTHEEVSLNGGMEFRRVPTGIDVTELMRSFGE